MEAIVVTYNSECELAGLAESAHLSDNFEDIVVIDNGSTDETETVARKAGMHFIALDRNAGFGGAANAGAMCTSGPCFALINPDIRFTTPADTGTLAEQLADPRVGVVGPRLVLPDGTTQDSARVIPTPVDLVRRRVTHRPYGALTGGGTRTVPWVVGGCLIIRRTAFANVGGFDPRYFLYFEDVDLCLRLSHQGWRVRFDPRVVVRHEHGAASRARLSSRAARHHIRSAARFYLKNPQYLSPRHGEPVRPPAGLGVVTD